ncbi:monofunctional biosynthetic peptidoglycan transglycosylase [Aliamphritea ceti]|uniref:monofunctional biosynthetic peptidoglycan transglycosylase n=1 Tax=Aliamphritea ceti TaxID=1524258 RepID=UPI0021C27334|nr:monofunctional biosynthetic peptidoglycan transglycosylase [Aliamphritea ceti]
MKLKRLVVCFLLVLCLLPFALVATVKFIDPPTWSWQIQRWLNPPDGYPDDVLHQWVDLENISENMQLAVIASEDQLFPEHDGLDWESIEKALEERNAGKRTRGASTITQQASKNLFLWPAKNYVRKGLEAGLAVLMDAICGKQRTLELYLNIVEFGPGIYGVEAASQHFFNRSAERLTVKQSALLASVLPNPYRFNAAAPSQYMQKRVRWIMRQMRQLGVATIAGLSL